MYMTLYYIFVFECRCQSNATLDPSHDKMLRSFFKSRMFSFRAWFMTSFFLVDVGGCVNAKLHRNSFSVCKINFGPFCRFFSDQDNTMMLIFLWPIRYDIYGISFGSRTSRVRQDRCIAVMPRWRQHNSEYKQNGDENLRMHISTIIVLLLREISNDCRSAPVVPAFCNFAARKIIREHARDIAISYRLLNVIKSYRRRKRYR